LLFAGALSAGGKPGDVDVTGGDVDVTGGDVVFLAK
jgi:hypothetical protein